MLKTQQPKGLYFLFFTELWERFGYYSLQTIIVLYLVQGLGFNDTRAYLLYGTFSAMQYLTPAIGGYLADKYMGYQRAIIIGGWLFVLGYVLTALPFNSVFFIGLSVLIIANGLFKPNVSSIVGTLYERNDHRREAGFTIFYMGINIGSLIPPLFIGAIVLHWGWHAGFGIAAIGMLLGIINFMIGRSRLNHHGKEPDNSPLKRTGKRRRFLVLFWIGLVLLTIVFNIAFLFPEATDVVVLVATLITIVCALYFVCREKRAERNKMIACLLLILVSIGFWALYNQTFSSLMLFAERNMLTGFLGFHIDAEFTQFFNPFWIFVFSPVLSKLWITLSRRKRNPAAPLKFALGIACIAAGFYALAVGVTYYHTADGLVDPWWLALSYLIQTIGELLLSPIGLAMITMLSPARYIGMMMGVWFLAQSSAFAISGGLASIASVPDNVNTATSLLIYTHAFYVYGNIALVLTIIALAAVPFLNRLIQGKAKARFARAHDEHVGRLP